MSQFRCLLTGAGALLREHVDAALLAGSGMRLQTDVQHRRQHPPEETVFYHQIKGRLLSVPLSSHPSPFLPLLSLFPCLSPMSPPLSFLLSPHFCLRLSLSHPAPLSVLFLTLSLTLSHLSFFPCPTVSLSLLISPPLCVAISLALSLPLPSLP